MRSAAQRILACTIAAGFLAGCSSSIDTIEANGLAATASTSSAEFSGPGITVGGGVSVARLTPTEPDKASALYGPWTLARAGTPSCTVDLGSANAAGNLAARTRRCSTVELARIAFWTPVGEGLVLYDFESRPVVSLSPAGLGFYEGELFDGTRLTLFR